MQFCTNYSYGNKLTTPHTNFRKTNVDAERHASTQYHKEAQGRLFAFLVTEAQPEKRIDLQLDRSQTYQIQKNREKTKAILQPLIFCGSYGLNIRGKVDHGDVIIGENATSGVYRGLLTFLYRQETRSLKAKLKTAKKNTLCPRKKRPPSMFKNY